MPTVRLTVAINAVYLGYSMAREKFAPFQLPASVIYFSYHTIRSALKPLQFAYDASQLEHRHYDPQAPFNETYPKSLLDIHYSSSFALFGTNFFQFASNINTARSMEFSFKLFNVIVKPEPIGLFSLAASTGASLLVHRWEEQQKEYLDWLIEFGAEIQSGSSHINETEAADNIQKMADNNYSSHWLTWTEPAVGLFITAVSFMPWCLRAPNLKVENNVPNVVGNVLRTPPHPPAGTGEVGGTPPREVVDTAVNQQTPVISPEWMKIPILPSILSNVRHVGYHACAEQKCSLREIVVTDVAKNMLQDLPQGFLSRYFDCSGATPPPTKDNMLSLILDRQCSKLDTPLPQVLDGQCSEVIGIVASEREL